MPNALTRTGMLPSVFDDFFRPWNEWFDQGSLMSRMLTVPAVNIDETDNSYQLSLAVPGMKKDDLQIDVNGNLLTISAEKEERKEEKDKRMTREEYNYSSFSRTFTLPEEVKKDKIDATYTDGVLKLVLPKTEEALKKISSRHIPVK